MERTYTATQIMTADDCAYRHYLRDFARVRPLTRSVNLAFGTVVDEVIRDYLLALALGKPLPNTAEQFVESWRAVRSREVIRYASTQVPEDFETIGIALMRELPAAWQRTGFQVALDGQGEPLIQRELRAQVRSEGVIVPIKGTLDVGVYTRDGKLAIIDAKSATMPHSVLYTLRADQLTMYQLLFEVHAEGLGLPPLEKLGFWDLLKRRESARIEDPVLVPLRTRAELAAWVNKILWLAEDDRRGRFAKSSRYHYNSPCEECEFASFCVEGDIEGLKFPADYRAPGIERLSAPALLVSR